MGRPEWTDDQLHAIEGRNGTMLVSAAAGSGKTAVLVERVMRRICDPDDPCTVENLLIVTFTRAAAAQMRTKISNGFTERLREDPSNQYLKLQKMKLPCASICTIDAFCSNLVRENYHRLDISPDFTIFDSGKISLLEEKALNDVLTDLCANRPDDFTVLNDLVSTKENDYQLSECIRTLHRIASARTFPEYELEKLCEEYENPLPLLESRWGKTLRDNYLSTLDYASEQLDYYEELLQEDPNLAPTLETLQSDRAKIRNLADRVRRASAWDDIPTGIEFDRLKSPRNYESQVKDAFKTVRDSIKKKITGSSEPFFISEEDHLKDMEAMAPAIRLLTDAAIAYGRRLRQLKDEENGYDFPDILHMVIDLLLENHGGVPVKTDFARELSSNYREILVDEYQDVTATQDSIFYALSDDDRNRFMVGDVKQSIYGFREAMPEIFLNLRKSMTDYNAVDFPARITLSKNFRSRSGITETVNFIFSQIMSEAAGEIEYDEKEFLYAQKKYPDKDEPSAELYLLEGDRKNYLEDQARFVADYIEKAISEGMTVTDGDSERPVTYSDFCILSRSIADTGRAFNTYFESREIPLSVETREDFSESAEVSLILSLLKIISSPANDIPLTAVMLSPVFGFTPDELAEMRIPDRKCSFRTCVANAAKNGNSKAEAFLERIDGLRRLSVIMAIDEFVSVLIDELGLRAIVSAMKNGKSRVSALNTIIGMANNYRSFGGKGLSGFISYVENTEVRNDAAEVSDCVNMCTIHASKGLEYPVVFLVNCERKDNLTDARQKNLIITEKTGIGLKRIVDRTRIDTIPRMACAGEKMKQLKSEKLRVLYVALTRPKEKLVIVASNEDWQSRLAKAGASVRKGVKPDPVSIIGMDNIIDPVLAALLKHPDANQLRVCAGLDSGVAQECPASLKAEIINMKNASEGTGEEKEQAEIEEEEYIDIYNELKEKLSYRYPFSALDGITAKRVASGIGKDNFVDEYFAESKPSFVSAGGISAARRGTATHKFMQYADFAAAGADFASELERLVNEKLMSREETDALDTEAIGKFFSSGLAQRMISSEKLLREYAFTALVPLKEINPEVSAEYAENEKIVVKGVVDCAFEENGKLVIVDYKTDRDDSPESFAEIYGGQLGIYRRCLSAILNKEVSETLIYSFHLGREIRI